MKSYSFLRFELNCENFNLRIDHNNIINGKVAKDMP